MQRREVEIPENVEVEVEGKRVKIKGPKGEVERTFKYFYDIEIKRENNKIIVQSPSDRRKIKATVGSITAHIKNMIKGVTEGFTYKMRIVYTHFPITVKVEGDKVFIHNFLGEKVPRVAKIMGNTQIQIQGQDIILTGCNKEEVGQTAANIEQACRITKYDRRVFQDGIYIVEKPK